MEYLDSNYIEQYINLEALLKEGVDSQCHDDFLSFVRLVAPSIVSDFRMGNHIKVLSDRLQKVQDGEIKRLMVFLPPRSSKSVVCSKLFPAWYLGRNPEHEILSISHSDQLASDFGRSVRDIVTLRNIKRYSGVSHLEVMSGLLVSGRQIIMVHTMLPVSDHRLLVVALM